MASPPKRINAKQAARDIKSRMSAAELMKKYEISPNGLKLLTQKLIASGLLEKDDLPWLHSGALHSVQIVWRCPSCGSAQIKQYKECPDCGIIVDKFLAKQVPTGDSEHYNSGEGSQNQTPEYANLGIGSERIFQGGRDSQRALSKSETEQDRALEAGDQPLEPRSLGREEWLMLLVGPSAALVCLLLFWPRWILETFKTLVHEMGHAIFGWLFGYPSLPAFDFLWGGGVTLHIERSLVLLFAIYVGVAALAYRFRKNSITLIVLGIAFAIHAISSFTAIHSVIILFMGHGTELAIAGLFIYRALSNRSIIHPAERPLYAVVGYFIIFSDIVLAYRLMTSISFREEYLDAKGGDIDMDFIRIARDYLHTDMNSVVIFFFGCCLFCLLLSFLAFRYEEYIHSVIATIWKKESNAS